MMNDLSINDMVKSLTLSHDGSHFVIGYRDGSIQSQVWNHLTNMIEWQMSGHPVGVKCVAFSYNRSHVVSGSYNGTLQIWDCQTGNEVALYQHSHMVTCIAFSCDGDCVTFRSNNGMWIWNPSTGQIHNEPDTKPWEWDLPASIAFSHNGNHVIYGWETGVAVWNVMTNKSTMLLEQIQLPDGTRVHPLGKSNFHIQDPVDEEMANNISSYLLSISPDHDWITGELLRSHALMPRQHQTKLSGSVWIGPECPGPLERPPFCPTDLPHGICDMCQGLAYIILFISSFWS